MADSRTNLVSILTASLQDAVTSARLVLTGRSSSSAEKSPLRTAYRTYFFVAAGCLVGSVLLSTVPLQIVVAFGAAAASYVLGASLQDVE